MIIGGNKKAVIDNIKEKANQQKFNDKVEISDPVLDPTDEKQLITDFLKHRKTLEYWFKNLIARSIMRMVTLFVNYHTKIKSAKKIKDLPVGAIITSNHFNPLDNTTIRKLAAKKHRRLFVLSQPTNLKMTGILGFLMNYDDIIPLSNSFAYLGKILPQLLNKIFSKGNYLLIYPEQEMWFNYRKPRPPKRGAYYYAAKMQVPIISCFVEIKDQVKKDNDQFKKVNYIVHVLPTIYPDPQKNVEANTNAMMAKDYKQKCQAYEQAYGSKLDYHFTSQDIAGWCEN